jgi:hypothetical protein
MADIGRLVDHLEVNPGESTVRVRATLHAVNDCEARPVVYTPGGS